MRAGAADRANRSAGTGRRALPWSTHLRICLLAQRPGWGWSLWSLLFPLLVMTNTDPSGLSRALLVVVVVVFARTPGAKAVLTGPQLRAFGMSAAGERRHATAVAGFSLVTGLLLIGVDALVAAVSRDTSGTVGVDFAIAAGLSVVAVALELWRRLHQLRGTGRTGDAGEAECGAGMREAERRRDAAAPDGHIRLLQSTVRRAWWTLAGEVLAIVPVQLLIRVAAAVLPEQAVHFALILGAMLMALFTFSTGIQLAGALNTWLVFGGDRRKWGLRVLRVAPVVVLAAVVAALLAVVVEKTLVVGAGWADPNALVNPQDARGMLLVLLAALASGVLLVTVVVATALSVQSLRVWIQYVAWPLMYLAVLVLLTWVWDAAATGWEDPFFSQGPVSGLVVTVMAGCAVGWMTLSLSRQSAVRDDVGMAEWFGLRGEKQ